LGEVAVTSRTTSFGTGFGSRRATKCSTSRFVLPSASATSVCAFSCVMTFESIASVVMQSRPSRMAEIPERSIPEIEMHLESIELGQLDHESREPAVFPAENLLHFRHPFVRSCFAHNTGFLALAKRSERSQELHSRRRSRESLGRIKRVPRRDSTRY